MQYSIFEKNGQKISLLGFGNMRLPTTDGYDSQIDFAKAKELVDIAYQNGVNYFDTAYGYHGGNSEAFVRKALADKPRESYFLATKLPMWLVESADHAVSLLDKQLQNLGTDSIDFYLFHALCSEYIETLEKYDLYRVLDEQRKLGKIKNIGFSFHDTPEVLSTLASKYKWDFAQIQYNYFDTDFTKATQQYDILRQHDIPIIVMEPVRGGRLADIGPDANAVLEKVHPNASIASWAMRWFFDKPGILTILSGMSNKEQVNDNLATFDKKEPLSKEENIALQKAKEIFKAYAAIPCTACRYCVPCPFGVDIPGMFSLYNKCAYDGSFFNLVNAYAEFPKDANGSHCTACKKCEKVCPQQIPISKWMHEIDTNGQST